MGQIVQTIANPLLERPSIAIPARGDRAPRVAKLVPGSRRLESKSELVRRTALPQPQNALAAPRSFRRASLPQWLTALLVPSFLKQIAPNMLTSLLFDLVLATAAFLLLSSTGAVTFAPFTHVLYLVLLLSAFAAEGVYSRPQFTIACNLLLIKSIAGATAALILVQQAFESEEVLPILSWSTMNLSILLGWRWACQKIRLKAGIAESRNALIIGDSEHSQAVARGIHSSSLSGRNVQAFLPAQLFLEHNGADVLTRVARQEHVDDVIIATPDSRVISAILKASVPNGLDVHAVPNLPAHALAVENLNGLPFVSLHAQPCPEWELAAKRMLDILLGGLGLIAALPLLLALAVLIKLDSPGPVLHCGQRIGRKGRSFTCYKLRTMVPHPESAKDQLRKLNQRQGAFFKLEYDPRVTRLGRWLRRYSLDELPQLWNVVLGNMSLVGPRPHPVDDVRRYGLKDLQRLDFIPGITGLWQVTARRNPSFERCLELDIQYIEHWNLLLDLRILWKTVGVVLQGSGT